MKLGFVKDDKDVKYLILFSLTFFPFAVSKTDLLDVVMIDDGFGYFEYTEAFDGLLKSRLISEVNAVEGPLYILTQQGREVIDTMAQSMRGSVRDKAERAAAHVVRKIKRDAAIKTSHTENPDGTFNVTCTISGEKGELLFSSNLMVFTKRQCGMLENNFVKNAEKIYKEAINLLLFSAADEG